MNVKLNLDSWPAYYNRRPSAPKAKPSAVPAGRKKDRVEISPEGRELNSRARLLKELEEQCGVRGVEPAGVRTSGGSGDFSSFLEEFDKLPPPDGSCNMAIMDMQANQNVRNQMERSFQTLFTGAGLHFPEGASFRLTVSPQDYYIRTEGLNDPELARRVEETVNRGDNGKKLYNHIQYCNPARFGYEEPARDGGGRGLSLEYAGGRLTDIGTRYGYGPGQTGWQTRLRENPEEAELRYMERAGEIARSLDSERQG